MKKGIKMATVGVCAFAFGLGINNLAISSVLNYKIATVDIQKIVASSTAVKELKNGQQNEMKNLKIFVESARKDVSRQKTDADKKALEEKYNKELVKKTSEIDKEYSQNLKDIEKNISGQISKEAKANNYNIVLAKSIVLYGGDDITEAIIKAVK